MMRLPLPFLAWIILCSCASSAQVVVSPRIGNFISLDARAYFGLFPTVHRFRSATAVPQPGGGLAFTIRRVHDRHNPDSHFNTDTTITVDSTVASALIAYIEDFESMRGDEEVVDLDDFDGLVAWSPALLQELDERSKATITLSNSMSNTTTDTISNTTSNVVMIHGLLLRAKDSGIVMSNSLESFNWRVNQSMRDIPYTDIQDITLIHEGRFWEGYKYGALIGVTTVVAAVFLSDEFERPGGDWWSGKTTLIVGGQLGALAGAMVGGIVGAILNIDADLHIDRSAKAYATALPRLKENEHFAGYPPPEVSGLSFSSPDYEIWLAHEAQRLRTFNTRLFSLYTTVGLPEYFAIGALYQLSDKLALGGQLNVVSFFDGRTAHGFGLKASYYFTRTGAGYVFGVNALNLEASYLYGDDSNPYRIRTPGAWIDLSLGHDAIKGSGSGFLWQAGVAFNTTGAGDHGGRVVYPSVKVGWLFNI